jgi:hypothetical protein
MSEVRFILRDAHRTVSSTWHGSCAARGKSNQEYRRVFFSLPGLLEAHQMRIPNGG